jgi:cytochrome P450
MPSSSFARPTSLTVNWEKLNEDGDESHVQLNMPTLAAEAALAIVAGSDTTGTSIASAMFFLIQNPSCFSRLRAELDEAAEGAAYDTEIDVHRLTELPYLQAVLNETMRIAPAVPNGSQRLTPHEGGPFVVAGQCVALSYHIRVCSSLD